MVAFLADFVVKSARFVAAACGLLLTYVVTAYLLPQLGSINLPPYVDLDVFFGGKAGLGETRFFHVAMALGAVAHLWLALAPKSKQASQACSAFHVLTFFPIAWTVLANVVVPAVQKEGAVAALTQNKAVRVMALQLVVKIVFTLFFVSHCEHRMTGAMGRGFSESVSSSSSSSSDSDSSSSAAPAKSKPKPKPKPKAKKSVSRK